MDLDTIQKIMNQFTLVIKLYNCTIHCNGHTEFLNSQRSRNLIQTFCNINDSKKIAVHSNPSQR